MCSKSRPTGARLTLADPRSNVILARELGVDPCTIRNIRSGVGGGTLKGSLADMPVTPDRIAKPQSHRAYRGSVHRWH
jgi:hypothetical protein